jgi:hypothetical protein
VAFFVFSVTRKNELKDLYDEEVKAAKIILRGIKNQIIKFYDFLFFCFLLACKIYAIIMLKWKIYCIIGYSNHILHIVDGKF